MRVKERKILIGRSGTLNYTYPNLRSIRIFLAVTALFSLNG